MQNWANDLLDSPGCCSQGAGFNRVLLFVLLLLVYIVSFLFFGVVFVFRLGGGGFLCFLPPEYVSGGLGWLFVCLLVVFAL